MARQFKHFGYNRKNGHWRNLKTGVSFCLYRRKEDDKVRVERQPSPYGEYAPVSEFLPWEEAYSEILRLVKEEDGGQH